MAFLEGERKTLKDKHLNILGDILEKKKGKWKSILGYLGSISVKKSLTVT